MLLVTTPTRVPGPVSVPTRVPASVSMPAAGGVSVSVPTRVPSVPSIPTERPYMYGLKQVAAAGSVLVSGSCVSRLFVGAGGTTAVPISNSVAVSGVASVRIVMTVPASNSMTAAEFAVLQPALAGVSATTVTGSAAIRAVYTRTATGSATTNGYADITQETQIWGGASNQAYTADGYFGGDSTTTGVDGVAGGNSTTTTAL